MYRVCLFSLLLLMSSVGGTCCAVSEAAPAAAHHPGLQIKDGWYYLDGAKLFVNALGYEIGARPGQDPKQQRAAEPERVAADMKVIKAAGFNAIRTWDELYESELAVVQKSGLKVLMGIGTPPNADFADPQVVADALALTKKVLAYTKHYDCIITYLIMNEPMPQHIQKVGAQATVDLWTKVRDLIHQEHPGIPVTISGNSAITEFVNMNLFDVYAYNAYDYDGFNYTHGYANACRVLPELNGQGKPLLLTEFGLSVSDSGSQRYGGNTLAEQARMLPWYYRQLLDGGAVGACPFYYADGWWKGGDPATHDDTPEEWFGFWGYADGEDTVGTPRPVWHALTRYNTAIVTSPKNQIFYRNNVPLEMFLQPSVASVRVMYRDTVVFESSNIANGYLTGAVSFTEKGLQDRELVLEFYDARQQVLKDESIIVLTGAEEVAWPRLDLSTTTTNLDADKTVTVTLTVTTTDDFTLADEVRYLYSTHRGWEKGERRRGHIDPSKREQSFTDSYEIPAESPVLGLYAGTEISHGKFVKTIHDQQLIYRGSWADPIRIK